MNRQELAAKVAKELETLDHLQVELETKHPGYLLQQVKKLKAEVVELRQLSAELVELTETDNWGNALTAIKAAFSSDTQPVDKHPNVPEDLRYAPAHWSGKKTGLTAVQAQKKHDCLLPKLNLVLSDNKADESLTTQVREVFFDPRGSFEDFSRSVLRFLSSKAGHPEVDDETGEEERLSVVELLSRSEDTPPQLVSDLLSEARTKEQTVWTEHWVQVQTEEALTPGRAKTFLVTLALSQVLNDLFGPRLGSTLECSLSSKNQDREKRTWHEGFLSRSLSDVLAEANEMAKELA